MLQLFAGRGGQHQLRRIAAALSQQALQGTWQAAGTLQLMSTQQQPCAASCSARYTTEETKSLVLRSLVVDTLTLVRPCNWHADAKTSIPQVAHPLTPSMQHTLDTCNNDSRSFQLHLQANRFESAGLDRRPAELLAQYITEVILLNKSKMDDNFVDKRHLDKASGGQLPARPRWIRGKRRQGTHCGLHRC